MAEWTKATHLKTVVVWVEYILRIEAQNLDKTASGML